MVFRYIFGHTLLFFYDHVDIRSLFGFLLEYQISYLFQTKKVTENPLLNSCIYNNICFDFSSRNTL